MIDQLGKKTGPSPPFYPTETFVNSLKNTLESYGFQVDYYECENTTVNFYKSLLARGYGSYGLTIFRVHSAIIEGQNLVGLFTNETYVEAKYHYEGLVKAYFFEEPNKYYFGIAPRFIEAYGSFENTIVILMGCNGLRYNTTAEAFVNKGAKAVIGWDGLVSANHTDQATEYLIQRLVANRWTVKAAVDATMEVIGPETTYGYNTILKYYPPPGDFTIPTAVSILSYRIFGVIVTLTKEELKTGSGI